MPLIRKIVPYGKTSKGIILPKSWLEYYERQTGESINEVSVEITDRLVILPLNHGLTPQRKEVGR